MAKTLPRVLIVAGSDPSGGAGIQADLKTAQAFGVYAQTAITALTVQNTLGVSAVHPVAPEIVRGQIVAALEDIGADAIKIGMLGDGAVASAVADALAGTEIPLVLDTVLLSSSGAALLDQTGVEVLKRWLIPRAALVTPNHPECVALTGIAPVDDAALNRAAQRFGDMGAHAVLFKGGHGPGQTVRDILWDDGRVTVFEAPRQDTRHTHGTGCVLASAIACGLTKGLALTQAVGDAHDYVQKAIATAPGLGAGHGPLQLG